MKIEKLYSLSQFVDLIHSCEYNGIVGLGTFSEFIGTNLGLIYRYNEFLKQPIVKDMFVNELVKPDAYIMYSIQRMECTADEMRMCREYEQAEKKVIFNNTEYSEDENTICIQFGKLYQLGYWTEDCPTLNEIAIETNGELELKNVEL